jgi:Kdo2-lipid IVA lauroyltransferase/acyltransferase
MNYYTLLENKIISNIIRLTPASVLLLFIKLNSLVINLSKNNKDLITIKANIKLAFPQKTQLQIAAIAKKTTFEKLKYFLDLGVLMHKSESHINSNIRNKITVIGGDNLVDALASKRGIFLVSAHFACFYYFLLANIPELNEVNILKAVNSEGRETLYDKLESLTNKEINGIYIKDKFSSIRTYKKLKSNKLVACMFDNFLDDTTLVSANFLGYPALASAGVAALVIKSNAILLPAFIVRNETGYVLEISKIIDSKKYAEFNINNQIVKLTTDLNQIIENYITQYPEQWQAWTTLDRRWNLLDE